MLLQYIDMREEGFPLHFSFSSAMSRGWYLMSRPILRQSLAHSLQSGLWSAALENLVCTKGTARIEQFWKLKDEEVIEENRKNRVHLLLRAMQSSTRKWTVFILLFALHYSSRFLLFPLWRVRKLRPSQSFCHCFGAGGSEDSTDSLGINYQRVSNERIQEIHKRIAKNILLFIAPFKLDFRRTFERKLCLLTSSPLSLYMGK